MPSTSTARTVGPSRQSEAPKSVKPCPPRGMSKTPPASPRKTGHAEVPVSPRAPDAFTLELQHRRKLRSLDLVRAKLAEDRKRHFVHSAAVQIGQEIVLDAAAMNMTIRSIGSHLWDDSAAPKDVERVTAASDCDSGQEDFADDALDRLMVHAMCDS